MRVWLSRLANLFGGGPWFQLASDKAEFQGERVLGNQLILTARDDCYQIRLKLSPEQADDLLIWLQKTRGPLNTTRRNKVIRLPISNRSKY